MKYIDEATMINVKEKSEEIKATIDLLQEKNLAWQLLKEGLEKAIGKKLTKRVLYPLHDNGYTAFWQKDQWRIEVSIWGNGIGHNEKLWITIPADQFEDFIMIEFLNHYDHMETKLMPQMEGYEDILDDIVDIVAEHNAAVEEFNEARENLQKAEKKFYPKY